MLHATCRHSGSQGDFQSTVLPNLIISNTFCVTPTPFLKRTCITLSNRKIRMPVHASLRKRVRIRMCESACLDRWPPQSKTLHPNIPHQNTINATQAAQLFFYSINTALQNDNLRPCAFPPQIPAANMYTVHSTCYYAINKVPPWVVVIAAQKLPELAFQ